MQLVIGVDGLRDGDGPIFAVICSKVVSLVTNLKSSTLAGRGASSGTESSMKFRPRVRFSEHAPCAALAAKQSAKTSQMCFMVSPEEAEAHVRLVGLAGPQRP